MHCIWHACTGRPDAAQVWLTTTGRHLVVSVCTRHAGQYPRVPQGWRVVESGNPDHLAQVYAGR